jgi:anaerobic C4-dicarboxylate transporter
MNGIVIGVVVVYGTAYVTEQVINYTAYYTVCYTATCVKNIMISTVREMYDKLLKKDEECEGIECQIIPQ